VLHLLHNAKFDQRFFKKSYEAHGVQDYTETERESGFRKCHHKYQMQLEKKRDSTYYSGYLLELSVVQSHKSTVKRPASSRRKKSIK
jgi:hypothetical protein